MQNIPFNGGREEISSSPPPRNCSFSYSNIFIYFVLSALCRICMYRVIQEYVIIHEKSKSTCSMYTGGPGRLLTPPPRLRWRCCGGGGEGWRAMFCLAGKGGSLASKFGGSFSRVDLAGFHGKTFWRIYLVGQFGTFIWRVLTSKEKTCC